MNLWILCGAMLSTGLLAQQATNLPATPEAPATPALPTNAPAAPALGTTPEAAVTNAPAAKAPAKKAPKKKAPKKPEAKARKKDPAAELKTVPLVAGPAIVIASNVNVRAQGKLKSEIVTRVTKGQAVTVLEEVTLKRSGPDEPSAWAKIILPAGSHVWVNTAFIEATNKTVKPRRLNVRGGPGENYSILGRLSQGDAVTEITTKGEWTEIEAPTNAYGFVAAQYLRQEAPGTTLAATTPTAPTMPEAPATPATVTEPPTVAAAPTSAPTLPPGDTNIVATAPTAPATNTPPIEPAAEEPPPKRIVQREGFVRGTASIQAPTKFELVAPDNGRLMDYLYTTSRELDLSRYKGMHIVVTGEEALEERWGNTPVLTIQKIQVLE